MTFLPATDGVAWHTFKQHVLQRLAQSERVDGRGLDQLRDTECTRDVMSGGSTFASSVVRSGKSLVQCVVKGAFAPPCPDTPHLGRIEVSVDAPLQSTSTGFDPAVAETKRTIASFVGSLAQSLFDLESLCIIRGEACWLLSVQLTILGSDGSVRGLCWNAVVSALSRVTLPRALLPNGECCEAMEWRLPSALKPVAVTAAIVRGTLVVDPTSAEETIADILVTAVYNVAPLSEVPTRDADILQWVQHGGLPCSTKQIAEPLARVVSTQYESALQSCLL